MDSGLIFRKYEEVSSLKAGSVFGLRSSGRIDKIEGFCEFLMLITMRRVGCLVLGNEWFLLL